MPKCLDFVEKEFSVDLFWGVTMRRSMMFFLFLFAAALQAQSTFDRDRLEDFYDVFLCEEKNTAAEVGLTAPCTEPSSGTTPPAPPTPPGCPNVLPIVLVNNTNQPDSNVYVVVFGQTVPASGSPATNNLQFVEFGAPAPNPTSTCGTLVPTTGVNTPPASDYSYTIAQIKALNADGSATIFPPYINSGTILFSIGGSVPLAVNAGSIATPPAFLSTDPTYPSIYQEVELTLLPPNQEAPSGAVLNQLAIDVSCLNYYALSISIDLYTNDPLPGLANHQICGVFQDRSTVLANLQSTFNTAATLTRPQWNSLILTSLGTTLRCLSPGYSMGNPSAVSTFDQNYLDNLVSYTYSWSDSVWTTAVGWYVSHSMHLTMGDGTVFSGQVDGDGPAFPFNFTSPIGNISMEWVNSTLPTISSTAGIFNVAASFPDMTFTGNAAAYAAEVLRQLAAAREQAKKVSQPGSS